jgi:transposase
VPQLPDLSDLSHAEKDALIRALWQRLEAAERRIAELEARLGEPSKTPDNSSLPPSKVRSRTSPRQASVLDHARAAWAAKAVAVRWPAIPTRR